MAEKPIREWRVMKSFNSTGLLCWFDPATERLMLRDLTEDEKAGTLDKLDSVSALPSPSGTLGDQMDVFGGSD